MAKLIRNVGKYPGLNGVAVIYLAEDDAYRKFLVNFESSSSDPTVLGSAKFMPRSGMESAIVSGNGAFISKSVAYTDLLETASTGLINSDGTVTISNARQGGGAFKRVWDSSIALFSIKGEGYDTVPTDTSVVASAADVTAWKNAAAKTGTETGNGTGTGSGTGSSLLSGAKDAWTAITDYVNANPIIGGLLIAIVVYLIAKFVFGIDLLEELGLKKKSKKRKR
ncbi:hypothetical protein [Runella sp.]|uniref:hypothetical protein n=1 Tax=Runella sp. TaxID=1960881 RepID=UPI003D11039B